jgi:hypothetical protein
MMGGELKPQEYCGFKGGDSRVKAGYLEQVTRIKNP